MKGIKELSVRNSSTQDGIQLAECKIKLFGGLRTKAGWAEKQATCATIREALEIICMENEMPQAAIFDGIVLQPYVRVMINGRDSEFAQGLDTNVSANDQIAIFPPIAGG
jgi:molybdopterin converting factor small subunit